MRDNFRRLINTKAFHVAMVITIIAIILFVVGIIILKYQVEGETNMPFDVTKVTLISSSESMDKDSGGNRWAFDINQNNDIYIYIEKNKNYTSKEIIKSVTIDNIKVEKEKELGKIDFYRPNISDQGGTFSNTEENLIQTIKYDGDMESNLKSLKIANQGGIIAFRYANDKIAEYTSNEEEINHNELLKKANIKEEDLKAKIYFDLTIETVSGKEYKANLSFELPIQGVVDKGISSTEITDLKDVIFKRTKN